MYFIACSGVAILLQGTGSVQVETRCVGQVVSPSGAAVSGGQTKQEMLLTTQLILPSPAPEGSPPAWMIILATLGGIALLMCLAYGLYKVGTVILPKCINKVRTVILVYELLQGAYTRQYDAL